MPYIDKEDRDQYHDTIMKAVELLKDKPIGHFNYVVSSILWKLFSNKRGYTYGNSLMGVLSCIAQEFYRRMLVPYEDDKIKENGDVLVDIDGDYLNDA